MYLPIVVVAAVSGLRVGDDGGGVRERRRDRSSSLLMAWHIAKWLIMAGTCAHFYVAHIKGIHFTM
jgi:hypothetical protein